MYINNISILYYLLVGLIGIGIIWLTAILIKGLEFKAKEDIARGKK